MLSFSFPFSLFFSLHAWTFSKAGNFVQNRWTFFKIGWIFSNPMNFSQNRWTSFKLMKFFQSCWTFFSNRWTFLKVDELFSNTMYFFLNLMNLFQNGWLFPKPKNFFQNRQKKFKIDELFSKLMNFFSIQWTFLSKSMNYFHIFDFLHNWQTFWWIFVKQYFEEVRSRDERTFFCWDELTCAQSSAIYFF